MHGVGIAVTSAVGMCFNLKRKMGVFVERLFVEDADFDGPLATTLDLTTDH